MIFLLQVLERLGTYDASSIRDPFTEYVDRLGSCNRTNRFSVSVNGTATITNYQKAPGGDAVVTVKRSSFQKNDHQEKVKLPDVSGGGGWEVLLNGTGNRDVILCTGDHNKSGVAAVIEIPLDFVIEKCLLEEIQLQYIYVSKLTIKLLEEGFSLQEHLLALRRYHMMESADWADLFTVSLWQHTQYCAL
ncbi:hypothetical protein L2E82_27162 [Cichorium intybus]|uniref:Uncharacterized protein n=1 Tax=Cichorium intybus TaxID=13427 RepID=A0ACB9CS72_CICIN|nr:hypothetical protein L2E82_27162 [Cichorium intybus]